MAANSTAVGTKILPEPNSLAAYLAEASSQIPAPEPALTRLLTRFFGKTTAQPARLPSGLEPDDAAGLASALTAMLRDNLFLPTAAAFQPENLRVHPALTGWHITLETAATQPDSSRPLEGAAQQTAFSHLLYRLVTGQALPADAMDRRARLSQLAAQNPFLAKALEDGLQGRFTSLDALAGSFGWSLYRKTHLNFPVAPTAPATQETRPTVARKPTAVQSLPDETTPKATSNRGRVGPLALVSLGVALALLAGTILFSVSGLDKDYRPQSLTAATTTPLPTLAPPTPTPAVALQTTRQADGATLTRYNPALDSDAGNQPTDPAKLAPGQVVSFTGYNNLQIQGVRWSPDGTRLDLALKNGGWESWDVTAKKRLSRKELPNTEQYSAVSWSPDGQNFVAVGLDGQLRLGKNDRILRTVNLSQTGTTGTFSTYPWPFSWSPDGGYLLLATPDNNIQLWNFQNTPTQITPSENGSVPTMNLRGDNLAGSIEWSGDSRYLARLMPGDQNEQIEVYNPRNLARLYSLTVSDSPGDFNNAQTAPYTVSNGLAWSPDGRYIAVIRAFSLTSIKTADSYAVSNWGDVVSVLEVPDVGKVTAQSNQAQSAPNAAVTLSPAITALPEGRRVVRFIGTDGSALSPLHLQTIAVDGIGDVNTAGGRNLVWSKNNRLLVLGTTLTGDNTVRQIHFKAFTLDLNTTGGGWKWQPGDIFELPFDSPHNFAAWSPDGQKILYNTTNSTLGLGAIPAGAGESMTGETLNDGSNEFNFDYFPSPDGRTVVQAGLKDDKVSLVLRDSATNRPIAELLQPEEAISSLVNAAWSPDGKLLAIPFNVLYSSSESSGVEQEVIRAWRIEADGSPVLLGDFLAGTLANYNFSYNKSVTWDATGDSPAVLFENIDGKIVRWDVNKTLPSLADQRKAVASAGADGPASTLSYYQVVGVVPGKTSGGGQGSWTWLPDHKRGIYCSSNCYIQELLTPGATPTTEQLRGIRFDPAPLSNSYARNNAESILAASPDGRMIAVALPNGLVNLYDSSTGKLFNSFTAHQGYINALNFSPDGKYLVTAGTDRAVKVWDTTSWRNLSVLRLVEPTAIVNTARWLSDNKTLALGTSYGTVLLWRALA